MKKWIILMAMAILFVYPVISLWQMVFEGNFNLYLLVRSVSYSVFCMVIYFYLLWTVSSKHPAISWSIFTILIMVLIAHEFAREANPVEQGLQVIYEIGWFRVFYETLYLMCSMATAFGIGIGIMEERKMIARIDQLTAEK